MTPDDLTRLNIPSDPRIAPDGLSALFVVSTPNIEEDRYDKQIWISDLATSKPLTDGPGDTAPRWSPRTAHDWRFFARTVTTTRSWLLCRSTVASPASSPNLTMASRGWSGPPTDQRSRWWPSPTPRSGPISTMMSGIVVRDGSRPCHTGSMRGIRPTIANVISG